MLRQSTYSTARFGLYNYFAREARQRTGQQKLSSSLEIACAALAGGMAGLVGNPTEVGRSDSDVKYTNVPPSLALSGCVPMEPKPQLQDLDITMPLMRW